MQTKTKIDPNERTVSPEPRSPLQSCARVPARRPTSPRDVPRGAREPDTPPLRDFTRLPRSSSPATRRRQRRCRVSPPRGTTARGFFFSVRSTTAWRDARPRGASSRERSATGSMRASPAERHMFGVVGGPTRSWSASDPSASASGHDHSQIEIDRPPAYPRFPLSRTRRRCAPDGSDARIPCR